MAGFLLLCLLWASDSLRGDLLAPSAGFPLPALERQALQYGLLAAGAAAFALARGAQWPPRRRALEWMAAGAGLFLAPALLVHFSRGWISEFTRVALFSLVPVFAVVLEPHLGRGEPMLTGNRLLAALTAVAGTLCVFPVDIPGSIAAGSGWCAAIVAAVCAAAANCRAVMLAEEAAAPSLAPAIALGCGSAATGFALVSVLTEHAAWNVSGLEAIWTAAVTWPALLLLFWLMRRMSAVRMTTRFVVAPLIANLAGLALLRPTVSLRAGAGLLIVAIGAAWLLSARAGKPWNEDTPQALDLD